MTEIEKPEQRADNWSKFWWKDWQNDLALKSCSLAARGLWIEMLAVMHAAEVEGHLLIAGRKVTVKQLAGIINAPEREVTKLLVELARNGVYSLTERDVIFSRRMVRDSERRQTAREYGKKGGNPELTTRRPKKDKPSGNGGDNGHDNAKANGGVNPTLNLQEARSQKLERGRDLAISPARGARERKAVLEADIPDWVPIDAWNGWLDMRRRKRAPATPAAIRLSLLELERFRELGHDPETVLNQSTQRGWTGLFEPRSDVKAEPAGKLDLYADLARARGYAQ
nr:hypothetical protein [uncultured Lichenicoccus sp.]